MGENLDAKRYFKDVMHTLNGEGFGIGSLRRPAFLPPSTAKHLALLFERFGQPERAKEIRKKERAINARTH